MTHTPMTRVTKEEFEKAMIQVDASVTEERDGEYWYDTYTDKETGVEVGFITYKTGRAPKYHIAG